MQFTRTYIVVLVFILSTIIIMQGIYIWSPWRQDISVTLPTLSSGSVSPSRVETPYGSVETDYTRIVNPSEIETRITLHEYDDIRVGMSYEDIVDIIWGTWLVFNRTEAWWQVFATYMYYGDDRGANANFIFQNNKLINKAQYWLK